ncbi:MAG TPA: DUF4012 domain-containing protein [Acidimicrobiales bacterium]|nr:DUF4012 domain-containing protein [Acidimicrobiales bacterium]
MTAPRPRRRRSRAPWLPAAYMAAGALGALGGARPTGIGWLDAVLLAIGGAAMAAGALRARTIPVYVAAAAAAILQPATAPLLLGCVALAAAFARRWQRSSALAGAMAGALSWACAVGVPGEPGARPLWVPMAAFAWVWWSTWQHGSRRFKQRAGRVAVALGAVAVVGATLGALAALEARSEAQRGSDLLRAGLDAARTGDTDAAVADLRAARRALSRAEGSLGALWARPAWLVPGVSQNLRTLHDLTVEVDRLAGVAVTAAETANVDALRATAGQIDLAAVAAVDAPLVELRAALDRAAAAVADLDGTWLLPPVQHGLDEVRDEVADVIPSTDLAIEGVRVAPALLGADGPATYLVLFTTPVEARATSGFPGNFAEVTFDGGHFDMTRFGRISELVDALPDGGGTLSGPADYLARYGRFKPHWEWRNLTMSPDFPSVASVAAELYPQSGGRPVDGVMTVDPTALAALLRFTGPIAVPGVAKPLTYKNAAQFLLIDQYVDLPDNPERIDTLEVLAETTFDRLQAATLPGPHSLAQVLGPVVAEGHLQVQAFADGAAGFLDELGLSGRYPAVAGDFVGVTTSNAAGSKIDLFLRRALGYDVRWDPSTGSLAATATITLTNSAPASGLPSYVIGNALGGRLGESKLPEGWNNTFVTLYTPWDVDAATLDGEPLPLERIDELGRHALSTFVPIGPGESRTLQVTLTGFLDDARYVLDLAPQPQVEPETATVRVRVAGGGSLRATGPVRSSGGEVTGSFPLTRDVRITADRR